MMGDALVWGSQQHVSSISECCAACAAYRPKNGTAGARCNAWVYCGNKSLCGTSYGECWLKYLPYVELFGLRRNQPRWTSGFMPMSEHEADGREEPDPSPDRSYHTMVTAQGTAVHWQSRIGYYWFLKVRKACREAGPCEMGGFTRVLHSGQADDLMDEIPTFVANPLPPEHPNHGYIVLNRPYAVMQWIRQVKIKEKYVLMSEPDHIWLKPMQNLMEARHPAAAPYFYIRTGHTKYLDLVRSFLTQDLTQEQAEHIAPIGNSPTLMHWDDLALVAPVWFNMSLAVHNNEVAVKEWNWVQEMYAFTMSLWKAGIRRVDLKPEMMGQPPWDADVTKYHILHYTYSQEFDADGRHTPGKDTAFFVFNKRRFWKLPIPRNMTNIPEASTNTMTRQLIDAFNEATSHIPDWDEYAKTGVAKKIWDGTFA